MLPHRDLNSPRKAAISKPIVAVHILPQLKSIRTIVPVAPYSLLFSSTTSWDVIFLESLYLGCYIALMGRYPGRFLQLSHLEKQETVRQYRYPIAPRLQFPRFPFLMRFALLQAPRTPFGNCQTPSAKAPKVAFLSRRWLHTKSLTRSRIHCSCLLGIRAQGM